ncbi:MULTISPECIES: excinuclease ABC subunit UvrC [unclassified Halorhodospira]|uniref:excinuclease ABC subunit UvrC n=1 Tax=unclassified Halorhodospira TaxID=2626748 RepID=UPI001EE93088|nr:MULTISPECIES: excinuclease ABC subunit UvrC [unclassified Halorhodospira]MCG5539795.1 excinuclease ABC subunit UvrC [Halorhodospira sp. M39old]MCG5544755.1 excinuclease ABC subunit UvrC [Halorhodospira sp. M38]
MSKGSAEQISGREALRERVRSLPERPGVYRMLSAEGTIIYVGKARNLRRRVSSYFTPSRKTPKTERLVQLIADIQITVTHTEAEALILENNLIKEHRPRYNVLLRDDKSYPYIYLSSHQQFPRLGYHRGGRKGAGRFFGPYPNSTAVRETLGHLQKVFPIRQCRDTFFRNRSRPCLQYQIRRCTAPCVGYISEEDYRREVRDVELFLEGRSGEVIAELVERMEEAAENLAFEQAARLRDRIANLRHIQQRQYVAQDRDDDMDVVACVAEGDTACVQVFFIRGGNSLGNQSYFPNVPGGSRETDILASFLAQHYIGRAAPPEVVINRPVREQRLLEETLRTPSGGAVAIRHRVRGDRRRWVEMAEENARYALSARSASTSSQRKRYGALAEIIDSDMPPERIECFDISHTGGEATVASCVVFNQEGPVKSDYRRFNIRDVTAGDDYAAMHQALTRRYRRVQSGEAPLPDLLLIDGGKGQVAQAREVLDQLGIDGVALMGIAKGPERRPGEETLLLDDGERELELPADSPALHLLQQVRDEAHRFAVSGHRQRRGKARRESILEEIPGLGPKRRQSLLKHFGGMQGIRQAGVEDLACVPGINRSLAQRIYDTFHG